MGDHHMGVVTDKGEILTWGYYAYGKLGHSKELLEEEIDLRSYKARSTKDTMITIP